MQFSIIVPCCSFSDLKECLDSVVRLTDFRLTNAEVIVSCNGCDPSAKQYIDNLGPHFSYLWSDERIGVCTAMNRAVKKSKGEFVVKLDDDCVILGWGNNSRWLQLLHEPFANRLVGQSATVINDHPIYRKPYQSAPGFLTMTTRAIWDELGGLDEGYNPGVGEDTDFSFRLQDIGYRIAQVGTPAYYDNSYHNDYPLYHKSRGNYDESMVAVTERNRARLLMKFSA
jgi:GT2 family glycosyltransferase